MSCGSRERVDPPWSSSPAWVTPPRGGGRFRRPRKRSHTGEDWGTNPGQVLPIDGVVPSPDDFDDATVRDNVADGLLYGDAGTLAWQMIAVLVTPVYAFAVTYGLLKLVGAVMPLLVPS